MNIHEIEILVFDRNQMTIALMSYTMIYGLSVVDVDVDVVVCC